VLASAGPLCSWLYFHRYSFDLLLRAGRTSLFKRQTKVKLGHVVMKS
jgi:hypothetical protein